MFLWKTLFPDGQQQNSFRLAMCRWNYKMAITESGRRRVFHRINMNHLLSISGTILSPKNVPGLFEDSGISTDRYLELFPHRMIHMGALDMTMYYSDENKHPVVFSYSTEFLEKQSEHLMYMNQRYYLEYCSYLSHVTEENPEFEYARKIRSLIFQEDRVSYQDQGECEVVLPELNLYWSDFVIVFSEDDVLEVGKWLEKRGITIPVFNLGLSGLRQHALEVGANLSGCSVEKCRTDNEGLIPFFETAMDVGIYEDISWPDECIFIDEDSIW